jgi:protein involved in polysaccharide export with SLBB domain
MTRLPAVLVLLAACGFGRTVGTELGTAAPEPATSAIDGLMSTHDREALARVSAAREGARFEGGYRIGPEDLLDIRIPNLAGMPQPQLPQAGTATTTVAEAPVFEQGYRVSADGTINLPLLGIVHVAGLTTAELECHLAERLIAQNILLDPQVNVLVAEYRSRVAAVVGSVERPGLYPITRPGMRLADLVWAAGGPTRDAGRVLEFRPAPDVSIAPAGPSAAAPPPAPTEPTPAAQSLGAARLSLERLGEGRRIRIALSRNPGDVRRFMLDAPARLVIDVEKTDPSPAAEVRLADELVRSVRIATRGSGLRVVFDLAASVDEQAVRTEGQAIVVDLGDVAPPATAVAAKDDPVPAGPAATASDGGLVRVDLGVLLEHVGETTLNPKIRPGDVVSLSPAGSVLVDGWVDKPGSYPVTRGLTLTGAIAAAGGHQFAADRHNATIKRTIGVGEQRSFVVDLDAVREGRAPDLPIADGDVVRLPASPVRVVPWSVFALVRELVHVGGTVALF